MSIAPENSKTMKNVEPSNIALGNLILTNKRTNFQGFFLEMVLHRAINDITQVPYKEMHFLLFRFLHGH